MSMNLLKETLERLELPSDDKMLEKFQQYMEGILEWNEKINLTAITDREEFVVKHFVDSLLCCNFAEYRSAKRVIDVGTGAGFPGIPLAIVSPDKEFILADSLNKRLKVVSELAGSLHLSNVTTIHGRAEELGRNKAYRESFDLCVSRAVANMSVLAEYCLPFLKRGGYFLAYKGPDSGEEVRQAEKAISLLGGRCLRIEEVPVQDFNHNIVVMEKIKSTPAKFPRKAGTPAKEPIF